MGCFCGHTSGFYLIWRSVNLAYIEDDDNNKLKRMRCRMKCSSMVMMMTVLWSNTANRFGPYVGNRTRAFNATACPILVLKAAGGGHLKDLNETTGFCAVEFVCLLFYWTFFSFYAHHVFFCWNVRFFSPFFLRFKFVN